LPQLPQFILSTFVLVQALRPASEVSHIPKPAGQPHIELEHVSPCGHCIPQVPQFAGLFVMFVQTGGVPHWVVFAGQTQAPAMQTLPPVHAMPHPPQLFTSVAVLMQAPAQLVVPVGHEVVHVIAHTCIDVHIVPQSPQFWGSVLVSTHTPPQSFPVAQAHVPPLQT
jgi:hypothetical protein